MSHARSNRARLIPTAGLIASLGILGGCEGTIGLPFPGSGDATTQAAPAVSTSTRLVERDVEAPEVFQVTEAGLWDGRPSLGGVWVAHPDVKDPERVIIRNTANGKFVIGALFRREREIPGPRIQVSSDAAAALGMLAGAPVQLNVTALRREKVEDTPPAPPPETARTAGEDAAPSDPIADAAAAAIAATAPKKRPDAPAADSPAGAATRPTAPAQPAATSAPPSRPEQPAAPERKASPLQKPYIQIGIFNIEDNAMRAARMMRAVGIIPTIYEQNARGKPFWRVVVGPARTTSERAALMKQVRKAGFSDAYYVTN